MNNSRAHLLIEGRVQGVFYRATARDKAQSLGLSGWVRNNPDGRVEVVVEGEKGQVEKFIDWSHRGSSAAKVENVNVEWEEYSGDFGSFTIKRY